LGFLESWPFTPSAGGAPSRADPGETLVDKAIQQQYRDSKASATH
jgi:hypothetical protein